MNRILLILSMLCALVQLQAQQETEPKYGIALSGFVKNDAFYDTRQSLAPREGHFLLWPNNLSLDANGKDINNHASLNMLAIQSRFTGTITGPDALGAKTSGLIDVDFFAQVNDNINLLRMRNAYLKMNWTHTELLSGQADNPLFVNTCFPGTVSFNTGAPFVAFSRNPQVRLTQTYGGLKIILAALAQRDYSSYGIDPANPTKSISSSDYLRYSKVPDLHFQLHYGIKDAEAGTEFVGGVGGSYKTLVPRLSSKVGTSTFIVDEKVSSMAFMAFVKAQLKPITIKFQARYSENMTDVITPGGFVIKEVLDTITGRQSYTPLKTVSIWGEIHTNGKKIQVGVYGGYLTAMGSKEKITTGATPVAYGIGTDISSLMRVSPRITMNFGKIRFAGEIEYTAALYGTGFDTSFKPATTKHVENFRVLLSSYYFF